MPAPCRGDFGILGPRESCTGDPARRLGNEYLFQEMAKPTCTLTKWGQEDRRQLARTASTNDEERVPGSRREFRDDPPRRAAEPPGRVGRLVPASTTPGRDLPRPCYLGRHNRVFDERRNVLERYRASKQVEWRRCREKGFCCGGAAAHVLGENIGHARQHGPRQRGARHRRGHRLDGLPHSA